MDYKKLVGAVIPDVQAAAFETIARAAGFTATQAIKNYIYSVTAGAAPIYEQPGTTAAASVKKETAGSEKAKVKKGRCQLY